MYSLPRRSDGESVGRRALDNGGREGVGAECEREVAGL